MQKLRSKLPPVTSLVPFEAAMRLHSISLAAAELNLTQAAVSKQVKALEEYVGTALFERRNRAVHPTEAGSELGRVISGSLTEIACAAQALRQQHSESEIVLRSQLCEGLYWLMPRLSGFYQTHPNIPVRVSVSTDPLSSTSEKYDLALQTTGRDFGNAQQVFTASDNVFPVCSPSYLDAESLPLPLDQLSDCHLLHHRIHPQDWVDWSVWLGQVGLDRQLARKGSMYDSYPMMMQSALEGHGLALGWFRTVERYLESGELIRPLGEAVFVPDSLSIYLPQGTNENPGVSELLDWLKQELSSG